VYRVRSMRRAARVVAISGDVADDARRFTHVPPEKIVLDYYGVDAVFAPTGPSAEALDARRAAGDLLVLHVGMNIARKNVGVLLEALGLLRARGLPVRFIKVGSDPREDGYREQMERLGLLEHFDYLGWLDAAALGAVYRSCNVLAFPSIHEGFGRPIVEAQACGLPVVVADTASAREIAGADALVHVPTDAGDLAARLEAVLTEPDVRARAVAGGFENVRRFSWAEHARILTEIYAQLHAGA
jgi:glycosyltransferase involved in cell wall biosynthesis